MTKPVPQLNIKPCSICNGMTEHRDDCAAYLLAIELRNDDSALTDTPIIAAALSAARQSGYDAGKAEGAREEHARVAPLVERLARSPGHMTYPELREWADVLAQIRAPAKPGGGA